MNKVKLIITKILTHGVKYHNTAFKGCWNRAAQLYKNLSRLLFPFHSLSAHLFDFSFQNYSSIVLPLKNEAPTIKHMYWNPAWLASVYSLSGHSAENNNHNENQAPYSEDQIAILAKNLVLGLFSCYFLNVGVMEQLLLRLSNNTEPSHFSLPRSCVSSGSARNMCVHVCIFEHELAWNVVLLCLPE